MSVSVEARCKMMVGTESDRRIDRARGRERQRQTGRAEYVVLGMHGSREIS